MPAIQAIVETYVRLRNEDALLASKQQRLRVLAMCDAGNPMFERLRSQCLEEIAEIEAGLERLRPAPLPPDPPPSLLQAEEAHGPLPALPDPVPNLPQVEEARGPAPADLLLSLPQVHVEEVYDVAKLLLDPPPNLPRAEEARGPAPASPDLPAKPLQAKAASDPAPSLPAASPTPINPSPFLAVEGLRPAIANVPSSVPATGDFPARSAPADPPQFAAAVSPSFLASTILAGSISSKLPASEAKPAELMRLQIALEKRMKSQG